MFTTMRNFVAACLFAFLFYSCSLQISPDESIKKKTKASKLCPSTLLVDRHDTSTKSVVNVGSNHYEGDLLKWIQEVDYGGKESNQFAKLDPSKKSDFQEALKNLYNLQITTARTYAQKVDMNVITFDDTTKEQRFYLLVPGEVNQGQGIYIRPANSERNFVLQVPHPIKDYKTKDQGTVILRNLLPKMLMLASLNRCEHVDLNSCSYSSTSMCSGAYRVSDAAHETDTFFQVAHEWVSDHLTTTVIQIHGFTRNPGEPSYMVSDGTTVKTTSSSSISNLFRDTMNGFLATCIGYNATSCNYTPDGSPKFCGTTNTQSRYSNRVANACVDYPSSSTNTFLHVEQERHLRLGTTFPNYLQKTLKVLFP